jgi:glycerate dehydrogenase
MVISMNNRTVVLNAARMNYDGKLDLSVLSSQVTQYEATDEADILARVQGQNIVVTKELPVRGEILARFPDSVKLICEAGTGYNNLDVDAARARGITICNIPAYSTQRVAHTAIMMILNLSSSMQRQQAMLTRGDRSNFTRFLQVDHTEVNGKILGIVGAGHIGREVIKIGLALGMKVLAYNRSPRPDEEGVHFTSLEEVLRNSDYVSLHCPLTPQTRHLIHAETLALMKPSAFLINTARGALVDEPALIAALKAGRLAGAGLDVQETEPPQPDSPLYEMEQVILTPHMGWKGLETRQRLVTILAENISHFLGGDPIHVVS